MPKYLVSLVYDTDVPGAAEDPRIIGSGFVGYVPGTLKVEEASDDVVRFVQTLNGARHDAIEHGKMGAV